MKILLTNDDGINAPGLKALYKVFRDAGHEVFAVAPMRQQSGSAHSVTVFSPILTEDVREPDIKGIAVAGTPADCVKLGLGRLCPFKPDIVISGINQGPNAGPDIHYSGTVGAAAEAAHAGIPSIAVSRLGHAIQDDLGEIASHLESLIKRIDWREIKPGTVINVNYPVESLAECAGVVVCPQSQLQWPNGYSERVDPRGRSYWWFDCMLDASKYGSGTDRDLLDKRHVTITPLKFDYTDYASLEPLRSNLAKQLDKNGL